MVAYRYALQESAAVLHRDCMNGILGTLNGFDKACRGCHIVWEHVFLHIRASLLAVPWH